MVSCSWSIFVNMGYLWDASCIFVNTGSCGTHWWRAFVNTSGTWWGAWCFGVFVNMVGAPWDASSVMTAVVAPSGVLDDDEPII